MHCGWSCALWRCLWAQLLGGLCWHSAQSWLTLVRVALAAEGLPDLSLVGLDDLQPAHFELRGARHSVHRRVERAERA